MGCCHREDHAMRELEKQTKNPLGFQLWLKQLCRKIQSAEARDFSI